MPPARLLPRTTSPFVEREDVVRLRAGSRGDVRAKSHLDRFDGLHAHQRTGQHAVESRLRLAIAADADRHAVDAHHEHTAERVAGCFCCVDRGDHLCFGGSVGIAHVARLDVVLRQIF